MDLKTHIGVKVKAARQRKGLTQEQLAEAIGKAVETVSNIERGHALTGLETLYRISEVVGVPAPSLLADVDGSQDVSRRRLEAEQKLLSLGTVLNDDDLALAVALLETVVRHKGN